MKLKYKKGFTLIELLVVISIIGILSVIVIAALSSARNKSADSAIQTELNSLKNQASLYASSNNNSFDSMFSGNMNWGSSNSGISAILTNIDKKSIVHSAGSSTTAWAAQVRLVSNTSQYLCLDSTLVFKTGATSMSGGSTVCP